MSTKKPEVTWVDLVNPKENIPVRVDPQTGQLTRTAEALPKKKQKKVDL